MKGMSIVPEEKNTYYIDVGSGEISQSKTASTWSFKIEATDEQITKLREIFDLRYSVEWENFLRSHVPYTEYHFDKTNDRYDKNIEQVYQMLYDLGDEQAREHIESMDILESKKEIE